MKLISNNIHWLLLAFVGTSLFLGLLNKYDVVTLIFGLVAFFGVSSLVFTIEMKKRINKGG